MPSVYPPLLTWGSLCAFHVRKTVEAGASCKKRGAALSAGSTCIWLLWEKLLSCTPAGSLHCLRLLHVLFVFLTPSPQLVFLSVFATKNVEEIKSVLKLSRILRSKNSTLNHLSCLQADKHSRPLSLRSALLITSSSDGGVCRGCEGRFLPSWASSFREALYRSNREESKKL